MTFAVSTYRRARKAHTCAECRRCIVPDERYLRLAGATDGYGWSLPLCLACDGLRAAVFDAARPLNFGEGDGPSIGSLVAWVEDADVADELPPAAQGHYYGLLFAAREKAGARRQSGYL